MDEGINLLLADGIVDGVVGRLKSGKEADVWLVQHAGEIVAAKVYKEREARSFRNNAAYKDGRQVRNSRTQRAIEKGSRFGQKAAEEAWKSAEADALYKLHAEGVRVPAPVMFYEGVLLMEVVVDPDGHPAPRLNDAVLTAEQAAEMYRDLRSQVVKMLCSDIIHGDLSPFNVLLAWNGPVIIDFPQVVGAAHNNEARRFFVRDLDNLRNFFAGFDPRLKLLGGDAPEIWRAYERRELTPDFVPSERPQAERPEAQQRRGPPQNREPRREFRPNPQGRGGPREGRRNGPRPQNEQPRQNQPPAANSTGPSRPPGGRQENRNPGSQSSGPRQERSGGFQPNRNAERKQGREQGPQQSRTSFRPSGAGQGGPRQGVGQERSAQPQRSGPRQQRSAPSNGPIVERINRPSNGPVIERVNRVQGATPGGNRRPVTGNRPPRRRA